MFPLDTLRLNEIGLIVAIQGLPDWLAPIMKALSLLGKEEFFLILLPIVYWCVNPRLGMRLGLMLLVTAGLNAIAKLALHGPRPYWMDARVEALSTETSFGMPSGHAQTAVAVWGILAAPFRKAWVWWAAMLLALGIGFSRIYLGVHFISDVVVGLLLGALTLWLFLRLETPVAAWWGRRSLPGQIAWSVAFSALMLGGAIAARLSYRDWSFPAAWKWAGEVDPESLKTLVAMSGALLGLLAGGAVMQRLGGFDAGGPAWQRVLRWLLGSVGIALIWFGGRMVLPDGESLLDNVIRYSRYAVLTLWMQLAAPLVFRWTGLVRAPRAGDEPS